MVHHQPDRIVHPLPLQPLTVLSLGHGGNSGNAAAEGRARHRDPHDPKPLLPRNVEVVPTFISSDHRTGRATTIHPPSKSIRRQPPVLHGLGVPIPFLPTPRLLLSRQPPQNQLDRFQPHSRAHLHLAPPRPCPQLVDSRWAIVPWQCLPGLITLTGLKISCLPA